MTYAADQVKRFNRRGTTRVFWSTTQITTRTLTNLEAATELTNNIQGIGGFEADIRVDTIRHVGSYISSADHSQGVIRFYDLKGGSTVRTSTLPEGTAKYGYLYFIRDAVNGAGAVGSRLTEYRVSTVGGQDDYSTNIAMWSCVFAIAAADPTLTVT